MEALIVDPCCWSPALPFYYYVYAHASDGGQAAPTCRRAVGLRRMQTFRQSLWLDDERWVLRGVCGDPADPTNLEPWHTLSAALVTGQVTEELCEQADRQGVVTVAVEGGQAGTIDEASHKRKIATMRRLAGHPSLALVVLTGSAAALGEELRGSVPHLLLGTPYDPAGQQPPPEWAHVVLCDANHLLEASPEHISRMSLPVIAHRPLPAAQPLPVARAACDHLQRDLAPRFDVAGYIV